MSANPQERKQTLIIAERGLQVKVQHDRLVIAKGRAILHTLSRGQQEIGSILFLNTAQADMFLDAFTWCSQEAICMRLQSPDGKRLWSLTTSICASVDSTPER